jgi:uncharacterized protein
VHEQQLTETDVTIDVAGEEVVGERIEARGDQLASDAGRPCVVMAHGFGGTVDAGLLPFARRLAAAGLEVIAFDYRHFGRSGGEPRQVLTIERQLEDYRAVVDHARTLGGVDPNRIVLWGISYAGGHVLRVAEQDGRVAAVVSLIPSVDGRAVARASRSDVDPRRLAKLLRAAARDRLAERRGRPRVEVPLCSLPGRYGAMTAPGVFDAYTSIAGPTWRNRVAASILLDSASYRPITSAGRFDAPLLLQIADHDRAAPPSAAAKAAKGRAEVRHYPCGHFDVFDGFDWHDAVCEDQVRFLQRHLAVEAAPVA